MAVIPTYVSKKGLDADARTMARTTPLDQAAKLQGQALAKLGHSLEQVGGRLTKQQETEENFAALERWKRLQLDMKEVADEVTSNWTPGTRGLHDEVMRRVRPLMNDFHDTLPSRLQPRYAESLNTLDDKTSIDSARFELDTNNKKWTSQIDGEVASRVAELKTSPEGFDAAHKLVKDLIDGTPTIPFPQRQVMYQQAFRSLAGAATDGYIGQRRFDEAKVFAGKIGDIAKENAPFSETQRGGDIPNANDNRPQMPSANIGRQDRVGWAFNRFVDAGYSPVAAAGIVGNLIHESGGRDLNPRARNPGDGRDGSDSIGVGQWNSGRARNLEKFANERGTSKFDFGTQIDFIIHELNTTEGTAKRALLAAKSPSQAAAAFTHFERPRNYSEGNPTASHGFSNRLRQTNEVLKTARDTPPQVPKEEQLPGPKAPGVKVADASGKPTQAEIDAVRNAPTDTNVENFDKKYGDGATAKILNEPTAEEAAALRAAPTDMNVENFDKKFGDGASAKHMQEPKTPQPYNEWTAYGETLASRVNIAQAKVRTDMMASQRKMQGIVKDDISSITNSGKQIDSLSYGQVADVLGGAAADKWVTDRQTAKNIYGATSDFGTMSNKEIMDRVNQFSPQKLEGQPGYSDSIEVYNTVLKAAQQTINARSTDPAAAVSKVPEVVAAQQALDPKKPETITALSVARMKAQEQLGVPAALRSPITNAEAKSFADQLRSPANADRAQGASNLVTQFRALYGAAAPAALARVVDQGEFQQEQAQNLTNLYYSQTNADKAEAARKAASANIQRAQTDALGQPLSDLQGYAIGGMVAKGPKAPVGKFDPVTMDWRVSDKDRGALWKGDVSAAKFDSVYGEGASDHIMKGNPLNASLDPVSPGASIAATTPSVQPSPENDEPDLSEMAP